MGLKPQTLVLVLLAILLGGGFLIWELKGGQTDPAEQASDTKGGGTPIFSFNEDDVSRIQVQTRTETLIFARNAQQFPATWQMKSPETALADEAAIAFLLTQLAAAHSQRTLTVPAKQLADYGFQSPLATIEVTLKNKTKHRLILGNSNYNQSALYAQVEPTTPSPASVALDLLPTILEEAVSRPLADWKKQAETPKMPEPVK